jgi:hypothetical protein
MSAIRKLLIGREAHLPDITQMQQGLQEFTGFKPQVRSDMGDSVAQWDAEFVRFSDHADSTTRTVGVVVAVDEPLRKAAPGQRPRVVIPWLAIRNGHVYVSNKEQRLEVRAVTTLFHQGEISVIDTGIEAGEQIVVSDPIPLLPVCC